MIPITITSHTLQLRLIDLRHQISQALRETVQLLELGLQITACPADLCVFFHEGAADLVSWRGVVSKVLAGERGKGEGGLAVGVVDFELALQIAENATVDVAEEFALDTQASVIQEASCSCEIVCSHVRGDF